jgi:hypothetical protein
MTKSRKTDFLRDHQNYGSSGSDVLPAIRAMFFLIYSSQQIVNLNKDARFQSVTNKIAPSTFCGKDFLLGFP